MKFAFLLILLALPVFAAAEGTRGGGDTCEDRIGVIRDDIQSWIHQGGSEDLKLPADLAAKDYEKRMLAVLPNAKIRCVGKGDQGFPVSIDGVAKVCRFDRGSKLNWITCDFSKFSEISESDQYRLIHHEYAGLAGLESPKGSESTYVISNQITGDLVEETIKRLKVSHGKKDANQFADIGITNGIVINTSSQSCVDKMSATSPPTRSLTGPSLYFYGFSLTWSSVDLDFYIGEMQITVTSPNLIGEKVVVTLASDEVEALLGAAGDVARHADFQGVRRVYSSLAQNKGPNSQGAEMPACGLGIGGLSVKPASQSKQFTVQVKIELIGSTMNSSDPNVDPLTVYKTLNTTAQYY